MQSDDGNKFIMLARWFNPAGVPDLSGKGGESILVSMFKPQDQQQAAAPVAPVAKPQAIDDDIPF
jgi:hypothetical protein